MFLQVVEANDPRLNSSHVINFHLQRTIKAWKTSDPALLCVKPIPIQVLRHIAIMVQFASTMDIVAAAADMIIIAFFVLPRPGKYTNNDRTPFRLQDVQLFISDMHMALATSPLEQLWQARFAILTFTNQKNGVLGEVIGLACSDDPF